MKSKTKFFFAIYFFLGTFLVAEILYIEKITDRSNKNIAQKEREIKIVSLPNLAIATEKNENYLRHKNYANIFDILPNDGEVQISSKMSFVY